jgi:hypothetical protein
MGFCSPGIFPHSQVRAASAAGLPSRRFSSHSRAAMPPGMRGARHQQASRPVAQTIRRPQGFAPAVNPYRGRTVTPKTSGRFPPELLRLSRVLPKLDGHVTRDVFTQALFLFDRPRTEQASSSIRCVSKRLRSSDFTTKLGFHSRE